jgi:hypothetical protein
MPSGPQATASPSIMNDIGGEIGYHLRKRQLQFHRRTERRAMKEAAWVLVFVATTAFGFPLAWANPITSPTFPGKCVEAYNPGQGRGALLRLMDCNGSAEQDFRFEFRIDTGTTTLSMPRLAPKLCFNLAGPNLEGIGVTVDVCDGSRNQHWGSPSDNRLRPLGVDPTKCLTHATRQGKPETGWAFDSETDPGCEFPEQGGGGVCFPSYALFFEMMIANCDGRNVQQWRINQPNPNCQGCHNPDQHPVLDPRRPAR